MTNETETDVIHLYLKIEKSIATDDPSQSFLYKIERFESANSTNAIETFYTDLQCTEKVTDKDGNVTYTGSKIIQTDKRGIYKITEVSDWSDTDYDFDSVSTVDVYKMLNTDFSTKTITINNNTVTVTLPRIMYSNKAIPTTSGTLKSDTKTTTYPILKYVNKDSDYAFISGQAYASNTFKKPIIIENNTDDNGDESGGDDNNNGDNNGGDDNNDNSNNGNESNDNNNNTPDDNNDNTPDDNN